ncbi:glutathione S-transferase N-terminal domain-containing protein [Ferruginivarius sediminum]|uniref:GST N-terminal domain-containing protein n=1 Tax=Ferruginivarius sediminum TaxID=2661937 RepID=A0A369TB03_9PROT|nr:glutathione S-transferase N-terminal domain-containing protein [Ferruginivarius sediminum]RDD62503.1 hypothetical protein DRB17_07615 [Ferruginivarius sediminum]
MLVLYEFGLSPFAQKVKIALREKGIAFERRNGLKGEGAEEVRRLSRRGEVPLLLDGKAMVTVRSGSARRQMRDHRLDWLLRAGGAPILEARMAADNVRFAVV